MGNSSSSWSSLFAQKLLPWTSFAFFLLIVGAVGHSFAAKYTSKTDAPSLLTPCLTHSALSRPRSWHSLALAPHILYSLHGEAAAPLGLANHVHCAAFLVNDARCLSVELHRSVPRNSKKTVVALDPLAIRCKESSRCNVSVSACSRNAGHAGTEFLCGGLPRACLASSLMMPGSVNVQWGMSSRVEHPSSSAKDDCSRGAFPSTSEVKRNSVPPAVGRGNDSASAFADGDNGNAAATSAGQLLEKARLVQAAASGLFCILPLGFRVLKKIEAICHQELAGIAAPLSLPNIMPIQWLENSDRVRSFGPSLYRVQDRRARQFFLPPTSEEAAAWLAASGIRSHRELPQIFYQIGPKFRDEARPRAGCLRAREFAMLEVYSFHQDALCREATYHKMDDCFRRILTRVGAGPFLRVRADPGTMGGPCSHEYHVCNVLGSDQVVPELHPPDESRSGVSDGDAEGVEMGSSLEVAHCFQLPETYCKAARARFTDPGGAQRMPLMNSYGLGVSRLMAHLALRHQDSKGLLFPPQVAPFCVVVIPQPAARWNDGRRAARLGKALFRILHKTAALAGGPADVLLDDRQGLTLRQMQSHADLVGIPHQLIIKEDFLRAPGTSRVLCISRETGQADILPLRAALKRLENTLFGVAMSRKR